MLGDKSVVADHPQMLCLTGPCELFLFGKSLPGAYRVGERGPAGPLRGSVRVTRFYIGTDILPAVPVDEHEVDDAAVTRGERATEGCDRHDGLLEMSELRFCLK